MDELRRPYPLYNSTYTLLRLAPLYIGSGSLENQNLEQYARSLRDILVGEVLRGVRVGLGTDEDVLARVGALQAVTWKLLPKEDVWHTVAEGEIDDFLEFSESLGVLITVTYDKATYTAILLRSVKDAEDFDELQDFVHYPLLLVRMPRSLRETFTGFLSSTFDTRASLLHIGKRDMILALEKFLAACSNDQEGEAGEALENVVKDVQVVIGFDVPDVPASIKSIDFLITQDTLPSLIHRGREIVKRNPGSQSPFIAALTEHVSEHMALDLEHKFVKVLRIDCAAFTLSGDGKVKLIEPVKGRDSISGRAMTNLLNNLLEFAKGSAMGKAGRG